MVDIQTVPRLAPRAMDAYERYCAIKEERSRVEARAKELKKAQEAQEAIFSTQFGEFVPERRIPGNKILHCETKKIEPKIVTADMPVGTVITKGYSYNLYTEVAG